MLAQRTDRLDASAGNFVVVVHSAAGSAEGRGAGGFPDMLPFCFGRIHLFVQERRLCQRGADLPSAGSQASGLLIVGHLRDLADAMRLQAPGEECFPANRRRKGSSLSEVE